MTFDEALRELGIDATVDGGSARRAYLSALKRHPPERDPEGFMRVRQAFERVSLEISWRRRPAAGTGDGVPGAPDRPPHEHEPDAFEIVPPPHWRDDDAPHTREPEKRRATDGEARHDRPHTREPEKRRATDGAWGLPQTRGADDGGEPEGESRPTESAAVEARAPEGDDATAPAWDGTSAEHIEACERAVRDRPDSPEARDALVDALADAGRDDDAARAMCDAATAGVPGFSERVLYECPERAPLELLERAARETSPWSRLAAASAWRARGEPLRAARVLEGILDDADDGGLPPPVAWAYLDALHDLLEAREHAAAVRLRDRLVRAFADGTELEALREHAVRWLLVKELCLVYPYVPPTIWPAFVAPLAGKPIELAQAEVRAFAARQPLVAAQLGAACERSAPTLASFFGEALAVPESAWQARAKGTPNHIIALFWIALIVGLAALWTAILGGGDTERPPPERPPREEGQRL